MYYNIENWVWTSWSGQDSNSRRHVLHVVGPYFIIIENIVLLGILRVRGLYTSNYPTVLASR